MRSCSRCRHSNRPCWIATSSSFPRTRSSDPAPADVRGVRVAEVVQDVVVVAAGVLERVRQDRHRTKSTAVVAAAAREPEHRTCATTGSTATGRGRGCRGFRGASRLAQDSASSRVRNRRPTIAGAVSARCSGWGWRVSVGACSTRCSRRVTNRRMGRPGVGEEVVAVKG